MSEFIDVQAHRIEYRRIQVATGAPVIVFLHEGLGSVAMWRDFPERLARAAGCNALLYSRHGYGKSDPLAEPRRRDYLHEEALRTLPELLAKLAIEQPVLFGHSDGASIGLIYSTAHAPRAVIAVAPHVFVEPMAVEGVGRLRRDYESGRLREKLARYHDHPDSAFRGWNDIWRDPAFGDWCIEDELTRISCPVLGVQGVEDEYATMEQIDRIGRKVAHFRALKLADCRHSPHRDQPAALIDATLEFLSKIDTPNGTETGMCRGR